MKMHKPGFELATFGLEDQSSTIEPLVTSLLHLKNYTINIFHPSQINSYSLYSTIHKHILMFLETYQVTTSNIYTQPTQIKAIYTYYNPLKNKAYLIPTNFLSKLLWWNPPTTHTCPAISTFHLQRYSFFKIYSILFFMDSACRGVVLFAW